MMMNKFETNTAYLLNQGVEASTFARTGMLTIENLEPVTAVYLAAQLRVEIDKLYHGSDYYDGFNWEAVVGGIKRSIAQEAVGYRRNNLYGEARPAAANTAVRVELPHQGRCKLKADRRNKFADRPHLEGHKLIHKGIITVLSQITLPFESPELAELLQ